MIKITAAAEREPQRHPRILVLSASVGAGHNRAAQALCTALRLLRPDAYVEYLDVLEETNAAFRRVYGKTYFSLVRAAPHVVGYLYDRLDRPDRGASVDRVLQSVSMLNLHRVTERLAEDWDLAVCTHFLPAEIISRQRRARKIDFPMAIVTTDFDAHQLWINDPCEKYFVASNDARLNLISGGVPDGDITLTGIPIDPAFSEEKDRGQCTARHGLGQDGCGQGRPIVLQLAGGAGFGPVESVHQAILNVDIPMQIVSVAGKNARLKQKLEAIECPSRHRRHVLGFTDKIDELMAAADVVISKPGGLTTSEALARGVAMCIHDPIPGQETRNSDFLLENGCAIKANCLSALTFKMAELLRDATRLEKMRAAAKACGRPRAAFDVAESCLSMVRPRREFPAETPKKLSAWFRRKAQTA